MFKSLEVSPHQRMNEDTLAHVDLFSTLSKKEIQALAQSCQERSYQAGTTILSQGDTGVGLYVLKSGKVRIIQGNNPDRAEEEIGIAGPGDVLGEMALLDDLPRCPQIACCIKPSFAQGRGSATGLSGNALVGYMMQGEKSSRAEGTLFPIFMYKLY